MAPPRYDVVDVKYGGGAPAVLRHVDGSGFAYYQSGRKAICVSSHGVDAQGKVRRFGAVVHRDAPRSPVLGAFDEWGRGYADGQLFPGDEVAPKIVIGEASIMLIDGSGRARELPLPPPGSRHPAAVAAAAASGTGGGSATVALRINDCITLQHQQGRTTLEFQCAGVAHSFILGELRGEEVPGMLPAAKTSLADETMRQISEATQTLSGVREKVSALRIDPTQEKKQKTAPLNFGDLQGMLDSLSELTQSLAHPGLAPADLSWSTEGKLKKLLAASHPQCPGQDRHNWTIGRVSGKCTEERLMNTKPTVATPKTVTLISQLRLPELVAELAPQCTLLVVICLATYAMEQSKYAKLLAEKVHAELHQRYRESNPSAVRFVAVELTEISGFAAHFGIKEVPYCLMFQGGAVVYSKRLRGMRLNPKDAVMSHPHVLLVEPLPAQQLKLERSLRRSGCAWDLSMDAPQAVRLASRSFPYNAVLMSGRLRADEMRSIAAAVRRTEPGALILVFDAGWQGSPADEQESRKRFFEECSQVFAYSPSYTAIMAVLARGETDDRRRSSGNAGADKQQLLDEVLGVLERGGSGPQYVSVGGVSGADAG